MVTQETLTQLREIAANMNDEKSREELNRFIAQAVIERGETTARFLEIFTEQEKIRSTWTEEQRTDWRFHDSRFDALSGEMFFLMTGGQDTLVLSEEFITRFAETDTL